MENKWKIVLLLTVSLFCSVIKTWAQQDYINSFYMFNPLAFNPAVTGSDDRMLATAVYRNQWTGLNGAPKTMYADVHAPVINWFGKYNRLGYLDYPTGVCLGLAISQDEIGAKKISSVSVPVSARVRISLGGNRIAFGLKPSYIIFSPNYSEARGDDGDPVSESTEGKEYLDFSFGWYLYNTHWYVGLSATNLREVELLNQYGYQTRRHFFGSAGMVFPVNDRLMLRATTLLAVVNNAPFSATATCGVILDKNYQAGIAYRYDDMIGVNFSMKLLPDLRLGYVYEIPTGFKSNTIGYSHEFMLSYSFNKYEKTIISPRYFW